MNGHPHQGTDSLRSDAELAPRYRMQLRSVSEKAASAWRAVQEDSHDPAHSLRDIWPVK
jgi:hypothetical protein